MNHTLFRPHLVREVQPGMVSVVDLLARQMGMDKDACMEYLNAPRPNKGYGANPVLTNAFRGIFPDMAARAAGRGGSSVSTPGLTATQVVRLTVPCYEEKPMGALVPDIPPPDTGNSSISDVLHLVNIQWAAMGANDLRKRPACLFAVEKLPAPTGLDNFDVLRGPLPTARTPEEGEKMGDALVSAAHEGKPLYCGYNGVHLLTPRHLTEALSVTDTVWGVFFDVERVVGPSAHRSERVGRRFMEYAQSLPGDWSQIRAGDTYINVPNMTRDKFYNVAGPIGWAQCMSAAVFLEGESMKENPKWIAVAQRSELEAIFVFRVSRFYRPWDPFATRVPEVEWVRYEPNPTEKMSMLSATPPRCPDNHRAYSKYGHYGVRGTASEVHGGSVAAVARGRAGVLLLVPGWAYLRIDWDGEEEYYRTPHRDNNDPCKHRLSVLVSTEDKIRFKVRPIDLENHLSPSFAARLDAIDEIRMRSSQTRMLLGPHVWQPAWRVLEDSWAGSRQFLAANHWWHAGEGRVMLFSDRAQFHWGSGDDVLVTEMGYQTHRDCEDAVKRMVATDEPHGIPVVTPSCVEHLQASPNHIRGEVVMEMIRSMYVARAADLYLAIGAGGTEAVEPLAQRCKQKGLLEQLCQVRIAADGVRVRNISDIEGFVIVEPQWPRRAPTIPGHDLWRRDDGRLLPTRDIEAKLDSATPPESDESEGASPRDTA